MTVWNPNAPRSLGMEWLPRRAVDFAVNTTSEEPLAPLPSTVTETIAGLRLGLGAAIPSGSTWIAEVFEDGDEVPANRTKVFAVPNVVTAYSPGARDQGGGSTNLHLAIDDLAGQNPDSPAPSTASYITPSVASGGFYTTAIDVEFNMPVLTGKRIIAVRPRIFFGGVTSFEVQYRIGAAIVWRYFAGGNDPTFATVYDASFNMLGVGTSHDETGLLPEFDRNTMEPWILADLAAFDTAARVIRITSLSDAAPSTHRLFDVALEIEYADENRKAIGLVTAPTVGWNTVPLIVPGTGAANWAKATATDYKVGLRRAHKTAGSVSWRALDDGDAVGAAGGSYLAESDTEGVVDAVGDVLTPAFAVALQRSDLATSVDGQPYIEIDDVEIATGHTVEQEFRGADGSLYRYVSVQVRDGAVPTADLLVEIVRRSDGVVMFSVTFTPADFAAAPARRGWRRLSTSVAGSVLAAATQYARRYSTTAPVGSGWTVGVTRSTYGADAGYGQPGYGGTTDVVTVGGVDDTTADLPGIVATLPAAPAALTADVDTMALVGVAATKGTRMAITEVEIAFLEWTPTALAGLFDTYEVERDDGAGYHLIASPGVEATADLNDQEPVFGSEVCYRARVVRNDGVPSPWTDEACVTLQPPGCGLVFSSNHAPALTCAYAESFDRGVTGPVREYELPDADAVTLRKFYGRDGYVAFLPTERMHEAFTRRLLVQAIVAIANGDVPLFDSIRAISLAPIPYVCVRDGQGDRWFANVRVQRPRVQRTMSAAYVDVSVVVVATEPYPTT